MIGIMNKSITGWKEITRERILYTPPLYTTNNKDDSSKEEVLNHLIIMSQYSDTSFNEIKDNWKEWIKLHSRERNKGE